jgi:hypothetical protein
MDWMRFSYSPSLVLNENGTRTDGTYQPLYWPQVVQQICSEHPYIAVIGSSEEQTHAVVVHGFYQLQRRFSGFPWYYVRGVQVYDPLSDESYFDLGGYSSVVSTSLLGGLIGVYSHDQRHFGDTYDINKIKEPFILHPE